MEQQQNPGVVTTAPDYEIKAVHYKGLYGTLNTRTVPENLVDIQIDRMSKQFGCESVGEFIERVEGYDTLEEMRADLLAAKNAQYQQMEEDALQDRLLAQAAALLEVTFAEGYLTKITQAAYQAEEDSHRKRGGSLAKYLSDLKMTEETYRAQIYQKQVHALRQKLVLDEVAKIERITITPEEIEAEYQNIASVRDTSVEEAKRGLTAKTVAYALTVRKVRALLQQHAVITVKEENPLV